MSTKTKAKAKPTARMVNVPRSNKDEFYRYKMPELLIKIEGAGNGIKTVLVNVSDVAKALSRPTNYIVKYLAIEVGASTAMNEAQDRYLINGKHSQEDLMRQLDNFIAKYILCGKCENPETTLKVTSSAVTLTCKACGETTSFPATDKIATYILKQKKAAPSKPIKKVSSKTSVSGTASTTGEATEKKVVKKVVKSKKLKSESAFQENLPMYAIESEIDVALAAYNKTYKLEDLTTELRKIYDNLGEYKNCKNMVCAIFSSVFNENPAAKIMQFGSVLAPYTAARQDPQFAVMSCLNNAVSEGDITEKNVPGILKKFYDDDVITEENILAWTDANQEKILTKAAEPFTNWLKTAEIEG